MKIVRVEFDRFRALERFTLTLDRFNVLVGPNNSGKSTVLAAFRILNAGLSTARSRSPTTIELGRLERKGYWIPSDSIPVPLENVHTENRRRASNVTFTLSTSRSLTLHFPSDGGCALLLDPVGPYVGSPSDFRRRYDVQLGVIPVLSALEVDEGVLNRAYVRASLPTYRSSRHFRNYWYHFPGEFQAFVEMVRRTWPGISTIKRPALTMDGHLAMNCVEGGRDRELAWAGFGFQIWCQLLSHLSRMQDVDMILVDEPEIYLHPELQRRLVALLQDLGPAVTLATHSSEVVTEVEPRDIVIIDKSRSAGKRTSGLPGARNALVALGSNQNLILSSLARTRRVLFFEGDDFKTIRQFARILGLSQLAAGVGVAPYPLGGFPDVAALRELARGIALAVAEPVAFAGVFDRDYRADPEIESIEDGLRKALCVAHVWYRKELENYLLVPRALDRAIANEISRRDLVPGSIAIPPARELLETITQELREEVASQYVTARLEWRQDPKVDLSTTHLAAMQEFDRRWGKFDVRLGLVPGKRVVAKLSERLQIEFGISLSRRSIIAALEKSDLSFELATTLRQLEQFRLLDPDDPSTWPRE